MSRYRKIDVRVWIDERFRRLSPMPPCGQALWFYLLTGPETVNIPGLYRAGEATLAEGLGWTPKAFREAFREVFREGMAKADWKARVVWVPKAIRYSPPESPNVVRGWRTTWDEIPWCRLKCEAYHSLKGFLEAKGEGFVKAFREACPQPLPNQEQEQEQEQEESKESTSTALVHVTVDPLPVPLLIPEKLLTRVPSLSTWPTAEAMVDLWNDFASRHDYPKLESLSPARRAKVKASLKAFPDWRFWTATFSRVRMSKFLLGHAPPANGHAHAFRADFDWLLTKGKDGTENAVKVHDGRYDDPEHRG